MPCRFARHHQHGFSLTELVIVVAIIGVLMAIMVPNVLSQMPRNRLNGAARQVMGDLMAARMKAINENDTVKVFFQDTHRYTICAVPTINSAVTDCTATGTVTKRDIQSAYRNITLSADHNPVFLSRGTATTMDPEKKSLITLANPQVAKELRYVRINIIGRVKICQKLSDCID